MDIVTVFENLYASKWDVAVRVAGDAYKGADGENIAAQVFANLWARRESLDWSRPVQLFNVSLKNAVIDAVRARRETVSLYGADGTLATNPAAPQSEDNAAGRLANVLEVLTDDQRAVLLLRAEDMKFGEIATQLGITEDAAKKLAKRARARLERAAADAAA